MASPPSCDFCSGLRLLPVHCLVPGHYGGGRVQEHTWAHFQSMRAACFGGPQYRDAARIPKSWRLHCFSSAPHFLKEPHFFAEGLQVQMKTQWQQLWGGRQEAGPGEGCWLEHCLPGRRNISSSHGLLCAMPGHNPESSLRPLPLQCSFLKKIHQDLFHFSGLLFSGCLFQLLILGIYISLFA